MVTPAPDEVEAIATRESQTRRADPLKPGLRIVSSDRVVDVLNHPAHQANAQAVLDLVMWLRDCTSPVDFYNFQVELFHALYTVEQRRAECSRLIKRLRRGKGAPADAPGPPPHGDPTSASSWQFEAYVFERIARQLRCVGDGLAWKAFSFDRRYILALSRNASPGPMFDKMGLDYELGAIVESWSTDKRFVLLHDLTNCLRIADLTEFTDDNWRWLREIKKSGRKDPVQVARIQRVIDAIMNGGDLPGTDGARLVVLDARHRNNLNDLDDLLQLAKKHGCRGMKLPGGRAVIATAVDPAIGRWGSDPRAGAAAMQSVRERAINPHCSVVDSLGVVGWPGPCRVVSMMGWPIRDALKLWSKLGLGWSLGLWWAVSGAVVTQVRCAAGWR